MNQKMLAVAALIFTLALAPISEAAKGRRSRTRASATTSQTNWVRLAVGPGMAFSSGKNGFAANVSAGARVSSTLPLYVGLDTGMDFFSTTSKHLPLLASAIYQMAPTQGMVPYVGLSIGPSLGLGDDANTGFTFLFRGGFDIQATQTLDINFDATLGSFRGNFYLSPTANLVIKLG